MTNIEDIRSYLANRYGVEVEDVKTGTEAGEEAAGMYEGDADAWLVYGEMPNTNETGWFFAGWTSDVARDIRTERE